MDPSEIFGGAVGITSGVINNLFGMEREDQARRENFRFNEKAAQNADARTRALYADIYSPGALLKQYGEAGLSPSLMFGGTPGQGGTSGAQGAGTNQPSTYMPVDIMNSMLAAAQIKNINAQTTKTNAETKNIQEDTIGKEIANQIQSYFQNEKSIEYGLFNSDWKDENGKTTSLYEQAVKAKSLDSFIEYVRKSAKQGGQPEWILSSEYGMKTLRKVYMESNRFETDINILGSAKVNAEFQKQVLEALKSSEFAEKNAESAVAYLKANIQTNNLTESEQGAWNDLLERIGSKSETAKDILIVLGMIVNRFAGTVGANYSIPNGQVAPHVTNNYVNGK